MPKAHSSSLCSRIAVATAVPLLILLAIWALLTWAARILPSLQKISRGRVGNYKRALFAIHRAPAHPSAAYCATGQPHDHTDMDETVGGPQLRRKHNRVHRPVKGPNSC